MKRVTLPVGDAAVLIELAPAAVLKFAAAIQGRRHPAVTDVVPAERTILVRFQPQLARQAAISRWLESLPADVADLDPGPLLELDVNYDGEDLSEVSRLTRLSVPELIAAHTGQEWVVSFSGFVPGFGYLRPVPGSGTQNPESLLVPRRDEPRVRVPAGSVALAAGYTGIYPRASPGGWQLIGRTSAVLWDQDRDPPALLRPAVRVRFRDVAAGRWNT